MLLHIELRNILPRFNQREEYEGVMLSTVHGYYEQTWIQGNKDDLADFLVSSLLSIYVVYVIRTPYFYIKLNLLQYFRSLSLPRWCWRRSLSPSTTFQLFRLVSWLVVARLVGWWLGWLVARKVGWF